MDLAQKKTLVLHSLEIISFFPLSWRKVVRTDITAPLLANVGAIREKTLIYLSIIQRLFFYLRTKIAYKKFAYVFILQWMPRSRWLFFRATQIFLKFDPFDKYRVLLISFTCQTYSLQFTHLKFPLNEIYVYIFSLYLWN